MVVLCGLSAAGAAAATNFAWSLESQYHRNGNNPGSISGAVTAGVCGGAIGAIGVVINFPGLVSGALSPLTLGNFCSAIAEEFLKRRSQMPTGIGVPRN